MGWLPAPAGIAQGLAAFSHDGTVLFGLADQLQCGPSCSCSQRATIRFNLFQ
jgi:hypothetical protein